MAVQLSVCVAAASFSAELAQPIVALDGPRALIAAATAHAANAIVQAGPRV